MTVALDRRLTKIEAALIAAPLAGWSDEKLEARIAEISAELGCADELAEAGADTSGRALSALITKWKAEANART